LTDRSIQKIEISSKIAYKDKVFELKDLLNMRMLLHDKITQVLGALDLDSEATGDIFNDMMKYY